MLETAKNKKKKNERQNHQTIHTAQGMIIVNPSELVKT